MAEGTIPDAVDVLIVGGGPVGLALAAELGSRRVSTLLVEKGDGTIFHPRANTVNSRTMEFCRRWGIADKVRASGAPAEFPPDILYMTSLQGFPIARIARPTHGGTKPLPHTPERSQRCNQIWFDPILRERAEGFPSVSLRYQTTFEDFSQDDSGVTATLRETAGGSARQVRAKYLVACCGGGSVVRQKLGVTMEGIQVLSYHLNIFVRIQELWTRHDKGKAAFYNFLGATGRDANLIELNGNDLWRLGLSFGPERVPSDKVDVAALIAKFIGPDVPFEVISVLPWTCRSIVADKWREGRVMLAGDAVHQHGPAGGFGMNTGLGDAVDLGWKLAALVQGWGGPALLESYQAERRPVAQRNVAEATENMGLLTDTKDMTGIDEDTPRGAALRLQVGEEILRNKTKQYVSDGIALGYRYEHSPIVVPDGTPAPPDTTMEYHQTSRPGGRAPHAFLPDGRSTIDLFGERFVLLRFGGDAGPIERAAVLRGVPLRTVAIADAEIAHLYEHALVLVRPDGHVAWRGDAAPEDALRLIDTVRGAATGNPVRAERASAMAQ